MSTATATVPKPSIPKALPAARGNVVLRNISWETYRRLRAESVGQHHKMTFDRGRLEILSPLRIHEVATRFLDQIVSITSVELRIRIAGYRATTWQRKLSDRGLEADEYYYIQNVAIAEERGTEIDIERDPPPDLAVETDVTHSTIDKESVYAGLGVPELWRWDNGRFRIRLLAEGGA